MRKLIVALSLILLSNNMLQAQINKKVEVTKAYVPTVEQAQKPLLKASIIDTAYISPDIDYSVTPLSISTPLHSKPIKPASVTYWEFNRPALAQVKVGAGYSLNSLLQANLSTQNKSVGYFAADVDHSGNYSDIKNISGDAIDATQVLNSVALDGGLYLGKHTLGGSVSYANDIYHNYAYEQLQSPFINYQDLEAALYFGDNFVDLSRLNYSISSEYSYFADRANNSDNIFDISVLAGQDFSLGRVLFGIDYQNISGDLSYRNESVNVGLNLERTLSSWLVKVGARYYHESTIMGGYKIPNGYLLPELSVKKAIATPVDLFAEIGGSVEANSYKRLAEINPFVCPGLSAESSVEYNLKGGIMGQLNSSKLSYHLYLGYDISPKSRYWGLNIVEDGSNQSDKVSNCYFDLDMAELNTASLNVDMSYMPHANWTMCLDGHVYAYSVSNSAKYINTRPNYDLSAKIDYARNNLSFGVKAKLIGERRSSVIIYSPNSSVYTCPDEIMSPAVDLSSYINWRVSSGLTVFVEGENLCNSNLYPWARYRGFGVQVTVGVKLNFR